MRPINNFFSLILFSCLLLSCKQNEKEGNSIEGVWESIGYGKILKIDSVSYKYYDLTDISCLPSKEGSLSEIDGSLQLSGDTLFVKRGISIYSYTRTNSFPDLCIQKNKQNKDPLYNFEVLANTYKNHYAYFELNNINRDSLYFVSIEQINSKTTDVELYLIMKAFIESLNDNHGYVEPTDKVYELIEEQNTDPTDSDKLKEYGDFEIAGMVAKNHIEEDLTKDSWLVKWGKMKNRIGYIQVYSMWLFADIALPDSLVKQNGFVSTYIDELNKLPYQEQINKEVAGIGKIMDKVIDDLRDTDFIIIDVRFNGGGQDAVGLEILSRFNNVKRQVASKKARHLNGFTEETPIYLESTNNSYFKPVYLLTSQQSASATDMMALSSLELPNIKRIGSHTNGAISDALEKTLPNGWYFSVSNEIYADQNENIYENIGIPVDYELNYPEDRQTFFRSIANNLNHDKQQILHAIGEIQNK